MRPANLAELRDAVACGSSLHIVCGRSKAAFELPVQADIDLDLCGFTGIVEHAPADQYVVVCAGTQLAEVQEELCRHGLCLPMPEVSAWGPCLGGFPGSVGGLVSMNLPHGLYGQCGGPRDWVLGMTVLRPDGSLAKSGSKVVKSVAGYDVHKLFIGARGTLGVVVEVTLRTFPMRALPKPMGAVVRDYAPGSPLWVQRTLPTGFDTALAAVGEGLIASDRASSTVWSSTPVERQRDDWLMCAGRGAQNLVFDDAQACELIRRTKGVFDPAQKFNPGAMGVV